MSSEENYLDDLLNAVLNPKTTDEPVLTEDIDIDLLEEPEASYIEIPDLDITDLDSSDFMIPDIGMSGEELSVTDAEVFEKVANEIVANETDDSEMEASEEAVNENIVDVFDMPHETEKPTIEEMEVNNTEISNMGIPSEEISYTGEELSLEEIEMPESEDELKVEDIEMPDRLGEESHQEKELSIDGLEEAIQSETELQMAGELNIDELEFNNISSEANLSDLEVSADMLEDSEAEKDASISMDDNLEDVLNMLDDDDELAEINDMLKKSDNNEPIQDDMMDLLHQMADDEAASVNAGIHQSDAEEDDGIPLPEIPQSLVNAVQTEEAAEENTKQESKKASAKKKKNDSADDKTGAEETKQPSKLTKFFNMLTEDLVPEPTEEELAAEKEAKETKKKEKLTQKEEEKLAKKEEKKAKAEEKAAANKAKQDAAAQKKKEKQEQKAAKKAAKLAAEGNKKRIPPKKVAAAVVFGASVGGAVIVATNVLSTAGFLQTARNAYYDGDYMTVYEATYGMELDDSESDGLIKAKSEVIFNVQRRYDSYQTNLKMGREVEALDALLRGITAYDSVNADAEKYEVLSEVDAIKATILNTLEEKYGLDEAEARSIIGNEDALSYTIALTDIIAGN